MTYKFTNLTQETFNGLKTLAKKRSTIFAQKLSDFGSLTTKM